MGDEDEEFSGIAVWQRGMALAVDVYAATQSFPKVEMYGLTSQMRRAAVSVPSNIAEGQGRLSDKAIAVFLGHARGSLFELETQVELAEKLGYFSGQRGMKLLQTCQEIRRMLNALMRRMKS